MIKTILKYRASIYIVPFILSVILTIYQIVAFYKFNELYPEKIILTHILLSLMWAWLMIKNSKNNEYKIDTNVAVTLFFAVVISIYLVRGIYSNGWQSLNFITKINNGTYHKDILYMSSIAEGLTESILPRFLINSEHYIHYHTFSNYLLHVISIIENVPAIISYNYFLPVVFFPIYIFLQLLSISEAKSIFAKAEKNITLSDVCILFLFNEGCVPNGILNKFALWKEDFFASESFLVANTLLLLFFVIYVRIRREHPNGISFIKCLIIPIMIFLISWSKISTGFILTAITMYFLVRTGYRKASNWILSFSYLCTYFICLILFKGILLGGSGSSPAALSFFPFVKYCDGYIGLLGHYLILGSMLIMFIIWRSITNKYSLHDIIKGKSIWEEIAVIVLVLCFLPSMVIKIGGGSAVYFTFIAELIGLVFFCGSECLSFARIWDKGVVKRKIAYVFIMYCIYISLDNIGESPIQYAERERSYDVNLFERALEIKEKNNTQNNKSVFYICDDADVLEIYKDNPISAVYMYSAITGIGTINASYYDKDGLPYSLTGKQTAGYGFRHSWDHNLTLEDAKEKAVEMGKDSIIILSKDKYSIKSLEEK